ncbi:hypothetical protein [uncultured Mediterranean phage uvDeep-CGR2-KM19-C269]|nr:hypothetical protein [uncultured Mediterranean phage uvDeep-CGR2-KM19-C269]
MTNTQIEKSNEEIKKSFESLQRLKRIILADKDLGDQEANHKWAKISDMQTELLDISLNLRK